MKKNKTKKEMAVKNLLRETYKRKLMKILFEADIFDKRGGRLQFLVFRSTYTNQDKVIVAKSKTTLVVR